MKTTGGLLVLLQNKKVEKVPVYFWSTCCTAALYMLSMKKRIGAEIKKIKNLKFICPMGQDSQTNGQRDGVRKKFGKNLFFENSFY